MPRKSSVGIRSAFGPIARVRAEHERPMRDLLARLPQLNADARGRLDFLNCSPSLLLEVAEHAETCVEAINLGISAIGNLIPMAAPEIEDGTISAGTVESLGWLICELSDFSAACFVLASECRQSRAATNDS